MGEKYREKAVIVSQEQIAAQVFSLVLKTEKIAAAAKCGQFISLYSKDKSRMLPRPISICRADAAAGTIRLVYRIAGAGTKEFSQLGTGDEIDVLGPLGNGFPVERAAGKKVLAVAGGIGIPPMLELTAALKEEGKCAQLDAVLGYRDKETFLKEDLEAYAAVRIATEDGSVGSRGNVIDAIRENGLQPDVIYACGPTPMLRALSGYAKEHGIECWLSLEEKMACGIGACLACVCRSGEVDEHSKVKNKRICAEGPVFLSTEVIL